MPGKEVRQGQGPELRPEVAPEQGQEQEQEQQMGNAAAVEASGIAAVPRDPADGKPLQGHGNLDQLYQDAAEALLVLGNSTKQLAGETGGTAKVCEELKGRERAEEKIRDDYKGNAAKLLDIARASIYYDDMGALRRGQEAVRNHSGWTVVQEKDRFASPLDGYRDFTFNVSIDGHVCELQLHLTKIIEAKKKGHKIYDEVRTMKAKLEAGGLATEDIAKLNENIAKMWKLYNDAFIEAGGTVTDAELAKQEFGG